MKRILILMSQAPGSIGVQALRYTKMLPFMPNYGWEFHFAGPSPELSSVHTQEIPDGSSICHYTGAVSRSREFSIRKNRQPKGSPAFWFYGFLQLFCQLIERIIRHDSQQMLLKGLARTAIEADSAWNFDVIAGITPAFGILETAADVAFTLGKPFVAIVNDPHGARDEKGFHPADEAKQKMLLTKGVATVFISPHTRENYIKCGLVQRERSFYMPDSYPENFDFYPARSAVSPTLLSNKKLLTIAHLGSLPGWRPIGSLLMALKSFSSSNPSVKLLIEMYGMVYPEARKTILADPQLARIFRFNRQVTHEESHHVAENADIMLVVIGPRHFDNQPSKFFEYLGHHKPILALGPAGNPVETIIQDTSIGVYCPITDSEAICKLLSLLVGDIDRYANAFHTHAAQVEAFSSPKVTQLWASTLDKIIALPPR